MSFNSLRNRILNARFKLKNGYFFAFPKLNEMHIRKGYYSESLVCIKNSEDENWISNFFGKLDGINTIEQLLPLVPTDKHEDVIKLIVALWKEYLIDYPAVKQMADKNQVEDREVAGWYGSILQDVNILLLGSGSIGSRISVGLIQQGVGQMTVLDFNGVSESDIRLSPAFMYSKKDEGRAEALASFINKMCSEERVRGISIAHDNDSFLESLISKSDFVIVAIDSFSPNLYEKVNEIAIKQLKRWSMILNDGWDVYIGPTFIPRQSGCYNCFETQRIKLMKNARSYSEHVDLLKNGGEVPTKIGNPAFSDIAAGLLVSDIPNLLSVMPIQIELGSSITLGRQVHFNMRNFDASINTVIRNPRCSVCSTT